MKIARVQDVDIGELVVGIDEAGRGPLAGPVVAAAVILDPANKIHGLADSKKLGVKRRLYLYELIRENAAAIAIGRVDSDDIDRLNILKATMLAMQRAVAGLNIMPDLALVDGNQCPLLPCRAKAIVGGDSIVPAVAAASIIAKVYRDNEMEHLENIYPGYGFSHNKGYPTRCHIQALRKLGLTPVHRRSFKPVADCIDN